MITEVIVTAFLACLSALAGLIPAFNVPTLIDPSTFASYGNQFSRVFPIEYVFTLALISLAIAGVIFIIDTAFFIYHQFWGAA